MGRIDDLKELRDGLQARMAVCTSDQNYAVMGRLLADVVKQIEELDPASRVGPSHMGGGGVLLDFKARLNANRTGTDS